MAGKFNIGRDFTLQIVTADGGVLKPTILTNFTSKQDTNSLTSRPLNGKRLREETPDGWSGSFTFDRANSTLDDYISGREQAYYAGDRAPAIYITETVRELDGSLSQYRYKDVTLVLSDTGSRGADEKTTQKVEFTASERPKVL